MNEWAKTVLSIYKYLDNIVGALDNLISKKCVYSSFISSGRADAYSEANDIIALMNRKIHLINLKVITEQALAGMKASQRKIITLFYVDGVKSSKIAEVLNMPMRSYFRQKSLAIHSFATSMKLLGYTEKKIESVYGNERWFANVFDKVSTKEYEQGSLDSHFVSDVIREYKSLKGCYYNYV